jgi:transglutaminase-like putative cysteine protease
MKRVAIAVALSLLVFAAGLSAESPYEVRAIVSPAAATAWVYSHIRYDYQELSYDRCLIQSPLLTLHRRAGVCVDMALLEVAMLAKAGVTAVAVSSVVQDHMIVYCGGRYWDPTIGRCLGSSCPFPDPKVWTLADLREIQEGWIP